MVLLRLEDSMKRDFIKGDTPEERLASTEAILRHMQRRLQKTVTVATPPIPFSVFSQGVKPGNMLGAFMFPIESILSNMTVLVDCPPFKKGILSIAVLSGLEKKAFSYVIVLGKTALSFTEKVKSDDRLIISLESATITKKEGQPDDTLQLVDAIWVSFLCNTVLKSTEIAELEV
jgi:hypothetical protein